MHLQIMRTNPTPTRCTTRPTGVVVARPAGFGGTATGWFHIGHVAHIAGKATATYAHRRSGEDAPH